VTSAHLSSDPLPFPFIPPPPPAVNAGLEADAEIEEKEREWLVLAHMEDVRQVARSILRRLPASVQLDDLIQAGCIGLIDAAKRFSPCRNLPFRQYARIRITGAIFDSLRELDWATRHFRTRQQKLDNAIRLLESSLGRKPASEEVADSMGMDLDTFFEFAQTVQNRLEVEFESQEDTESRGVQDTLADNPESRPDAICHQNESRAELRRLIAHLPRDEANVLILYYFKDWNMARIARSIGKTESRVSQIHGKAVERLREKLGLRAREFITRLL
jgi:RNA polymerase sigma factor for flagellar operon FliA